MGSFYTNVTLVDADGSAVIDWLRERDVEAFVIERGRRVVVFDRLGETQDLSHERLAGELSAVFGGAVAALVHDDDLLQLVTFSDGAVADKYVSCPAVYRDDADQAPVGGDAEVLVGLVGTGDPGVVERLFRDDFDFEGERHEALLRELGLPDEAAGLGFHYIESDSGPGDVVRVSSRAEG